MKSILQIAVIAALCLTAVAQTPVAHMANAVKICAEGCSITSMPVGTMYQFGAGAAWVPAATSTAAVPKLPFYAYFTSFAFDPASGVLKEFDVQQQAKAFSVTYSLNGSSFTVPIPALPPPALTPPTYKFSCTFPAPTTSPMPSTVTITCSPAVLQ